MKRVLITGGSGFIGTNLIEYLLDNFCEYDLINLDINSPRNKLHIKYWKQCDIKDKQSVSLLFKNFLPDYIIHLAAKASLIGKTIDDFPDNIVGTQNVVDAVIDTPSIKNFIHTSTQYVITPGKYFGSDMEYSPYTAYGESKAKTEKIVTTSNFKCNWVIVRPTNIWGPWHSIFPNELWLYLSKRYYFHPGFRPIMKYYGYVGNICKQLVYLMQIEENKFLNQVYYLTDPPIDNYRWMNAFSLALNGNKARRIPKTLWYLFALFGTYFVKFGVRFPLDKNRYFRLTVQERLPYQKINDLVGGPSINIEDGVNLCINWLKQNMPQLTKLNNMKS